MIARVRAVHDRVGGTLPDGTPYIMGGAPDMKPGGTAQVRGKTEGGVLIADRVVITKTDIASNAEILAARTAVQRAAPSRIEMGDDFVEQQHRCCAGHLIDQARVGENEADQQRFLLAGGGIGGRDVLRRNPPKHTIHHLPALSRFGESRQTSKKG